MNKIIKKQNSNIIEKLSVEIIDVIQKNKITEQGFVKQENQRQGIFQSILKKKNLAALKKKLSNLHPADIAHLLEQLSIEERVVVWQWLQHDKLGDILLELSDSVRTSFIASMNEEQLISATEKMQADEIADLIPNLPENVISGVYESLSDKEQKQLDTALAYPEGTIGSLMEFDMISVQTDIPISSVFKTLRALNKLPLNTDQVFVLDKKNKLVGILKISNLIVTDRKRLVSEVMETNFSFFNPDEKAQLAARAFENYDLISAPVLNTRNNILGRITVSSVVNFIREEWENDLLIKVGLRNEDLFSPAWKSAKNRWMWISVNLITAFLATRVISAFEDSIEKLVALATLMPIIATISGNSGNQTITLIVRALAIGELGKKKSKKLLIKELNIAFINGIIWGAIAGIFSWWLYNNISLGILMYAAMILNLLVGAIVGVLAPLILQKLGRDPALGSSVLLTFSTDSMGFLIFLGLATIFLI